MVIMRGSVSEGCEGCEGVPFAVKNRFVTFTIEGESSTTSIRRDGNDSYVDCNNNDDVE